MRVLLVEDNDLNRDMLRRRLRHAGHEVIEAADGVAAVERARLDQPNIILMDLGLPGLDGQTATRLIKADPATQAIPVVALTAHAFAEHRMQSVAAGCDEFHTKPVDLPTLLATMNRLCPAGDRR